MRQEAKVPTKPEKLPNGYTWGPAFKSLLEVLAIDEKHTGPKLSEAENVLAEMLASGELDMLEFQHAMDELGDSDAVLARYRNP